MSLAIRPIAITDAELDSSSVSETADFAYSATAPFTVDDTAYSAAAIAGRKYKSLTGGATQTVTFTDSNDLTNWTAHGLAGGERVAFRTTGSLPSGLSTSTLYYVKFWSSASFQVSLTNGGAAVTFTGTGSGTHTAYIDPNWGNAVTDTTNWQELGPTNTGAMFDDSNTTKTEASTSIEVVLTPGSRFDCIGLLGLEGVSQVQIVANDGAEIYNETYSLADSGFADDWYFATYAEAFYHSKFGVSDIPPNSGVQVTITLTGPGTVKCGNCIPGLSKDIGDAELGADIGIDDYTLVERDEFDNVDITPRTYNDRGDFELWVTRAKNRSVMALLTAYRATPLLFFMVPADDLDWGWDPAGIQYGLPRSFKSQIREEIRPVITFEIEGMS